MWYCKYHIYYCIELHSKTAEKAYESETKCTVEPKVKQFFPKPAIRLTSGVLSCLWKLSTESYL